MVSTCVGKLVVAQVDVFQVDCVLSERFANGLKMEVGYALEEHVFVVAGQHDFERLVLLVILTRL